jgi:MFS transporter, putative metabolite:H+ symporter
MALAMSLLARMDRLPFSRAHYTLLVIGGLGYTFDGADNALVAFLLPGMAREDRPSRLAT